ncbi:MAG: RDD family protein [Acidimicrobiia bacterium]|nr:RDD family protein [Acidimicrobiia bacterium]
MRSSRQDVSGNYAGAVTRLLAHWVDLAVAGLLFVIGLVALDYVLQTIAGVDAVTDNPEVWSATAASVWLFLYWWVSIAVAGKTIGKAVLGLRVVSREGEILSSFRSALRAISLPFSYLLFGFGFLGIIFGRERRALHDVVAGSAVIYDWGPRTAELPVPISAYLARKSVTESDEPSLS